MKKDQDNFLKKCLQMLLYSNENIMVIIRLLILFAIVYLVIGNFIQKYTQVNIKQRTKKKQIQSYRQLIPFFNLKQKHIFEKTIENTFKNTMVKKSECETVQTQKKHKKVGIKLELNQYFDYGQSSTTNNPQQIPSKIKLENESQKSSITKESIIQ